MLLVDARGIPLSIIVSAANRNDATQLVSTLDAVVVPRPPVAPRARQHLCADAGFVGAVARQDMIARARTGQAPAALGRRSRALVVHPLSQAAGNISSAYSKFFLACLMLAPRLAMTSSAQSAT